MALKREYRSFQRGHTRGEQGMQTGGIYDGIAGFGDWVAGNTDEALGRATDNLFEGDLAGVADNLAGSTDEAFGRAVDDALEGDIFGVADNLAGGFDEATGEFTSGLFELDVGAIGDAIVGSADEGFDQDIAEGGVGSGDMSQDERTSDLDNPHANKDFDRKGTPTTDGDQNNDSNNDGSGLPMGMKPKHIGIGAAALGGIYLMSGGDGGNSRNANKNVGRTERNIPGSNNNGGGR